MSYTDITVTRAEQIDEGNGTDAVGGRTIQGKAWQGTVSPETLGTWGDSGATLVETAVAKAAAGAIYEARACLDGTAGADYWLCLVDKASAPVDTDTIVDAVRLSTNGTSTLTWPGGREMTSGAALCLSTTLTTVTLPTDAKARMFWNAD